MIIITAITTLLVYALWGIVSLFLQEELLSLHNIAGAMMIVCLLYYSRRPAGMSLMRYAFPKEIWTHPSAKLDTWYYMVIQACKIGLIIPFVTYATGALGGGVEQMLLGLRPSPALLAAMPTLGTIVYTLILFIALDFALFYSHYLTHKYPLLWALHKVHHTARVLVPFTAMRFHPLDMAWNMLWGGTLVALADGLSRWLLLPDATRIEHFDNNMIVALSYITFHILRHSHIWVTFPGAVGRWLISPAQHQLHHSQAQPHWDKNFGYLFAGWDRWFGTLYIPTHKEELTYGVPDVPEAGAGSHTTIRCLLLTPLREAWATLQAGRAFSSQMTASPRRRTPRPE